MPAHYSGSGTIHEDESGHKGSLIYRHRLSTRLWHWINAATLLVMLMSGLMIFNAHPRLYWGQYGANPDVSWLEIGNDGKRGFLRIGKLNMDTTGVLGLWRNVNGQWQRRAFPHWTTIPSSYNLALSRRWHLTFAWLLAGSVALYGLWSLCNGHFRCDLLPRPVELKADHILTEIKQHATLKFPTGEAARHYNTLQKLAYLGVLGLLLPLIITTGLAMSPAIDAIWPWLTSLLGGRQSARSIHFLGALLLVVFVIVHLAMVILTGPYNEIRSMITGRFRLPEKQR